MVRQIATGQKQKYTPESTKIMLRNTKIKIVVRFHIFAQIIRRRNSIRFNALFMRDT